MRWIADAIKDNEELLKKSGLEVFLVLFSKRNFGETELRPLFDIMNDSGGREILLN